MAKRNTNFALQLDKPRCQVYLTDEKKEELLATYNQLSEQQKKRIKSHSDFYFFLCRSYQAAPPATSATGTDTAELAELQKKYDLLQIKFADYLNAMQNFARKTGADITRETDGIYTGLFSVDQLAAAMQDYASDDANAIFPTENFIEKLLNE